MTRFILRWAINAIALYLAVLLVPGIALMSDLVSVLWLALIFGLINALLRPVLKFLTCPLIILTLGLFTLVINTFVLYIVAWLVPAMQITGFWQALLAAIILSIISTILSSVLGRRD